VYAAAHRFAVAVAPLGVYSTCVTRYAAVLLGEVLEPGFLRAPIGLGEMHLQKCSRRFNCASGSRSSKKHQRYDEGVSVLAAMRCMTLVDTPCRSV